ncbi:Srb7 protein [Martiniozyma asiatica (nom. inval.)]|nr:Srb7 protein [Martiniozyma asiatica]
MADRLSQLQLCIDQLLDILFAGLSYVDSHHEVVPLEAGDPIMEDPDHKAADPEEFTESIQELSRDIIIKVRQVLTIVDTLPGVGVSEAEQMQKLHELKLQLKSAQENKLLAIEEKEQLSVRLNNLILQVADGLVNAQ